MQLNPIFDKYFAGDEAEFYKQLFIANGLQATVERPKDYFDVALGSNNADLYYNIHLPQAEFVKADEIIFEEVKKTGIPTDYPLTSFSDDELMEVINEPDKWSKQDIAVARIILENKGITVTYKTVTIKAEERYQELKKVHIKLPVLLILYILCIVGYVYSIVIGPLLYFFKHTDFNGKKQFYFSNETRQQGILLFIINILGIIAWRVILH